MEKYRTRSKFERCVSTYLPRSGKSIWLYFSKNYGGNHSANTANYVFYRKSCWIKCVFMRCHPIAYLNHSCHIGFHLLLMASIIPSILQPSKHFNAIVCPKNLKIRVLWYRLIAYFYFFVTIDLLVGYSPSHFPRFHSWWLRVAESWMRDRLSSMFWEEKLWSLEFVVIWFVGVVVLVCLC